MPSDQDSSANSRAKRPQATFLRTKIFGSEPTNQLRRGPAPGVTQTEVQPAGSELSDQLRARCFRQLPLNSLLDTVRMRQMKALMTHQLALTAAAARILADSNVRDNEKIFVGRNSCLH